MKHAFLTCLLCGSLIAAVAATPALAQTADPTVLSRDDEQGVNVLGVVADSLKLLMVEHATRIAFQEKTRRELSGPFWPDYQRSVRLPRQWEDTDAWWVNYIGHPIHGAAAGYIWLDHDPKAPARIGLNKRYWATRGQATAWAAGYSLQFEWGPLSEASIGNVGMNPDTTGWVDHVITPIGAFGLIVAEDALDRYVVEWIEGKTRNTFLRASVRLVLNPGRALSNGSSGRWPWHRDGRPLSAR